jgi:hypothetical protein
MPNEPRTGVLPPSSYVNFLRVANNQSEFFLSFGQIAQEQAAGAHLVSSLITTPAHAKAMLRALREAIERHEQRFGEIPAIEVPTPPAAGSKGEAAPGRAAPPRRAKRAKAESA